MGVYCPQSGGKRLLVALACDCRRGLPVCVSTVILGILLCRSPSGSGDTAGCPRTYSCCITGPVSLRAGRSWNPQCGRVFRDKSISMLPQLKTLDSMRRLHRESMAETLHRGYGAVKFDVVVAATYPVLQFARQYREKMFSGVPIVFTDVTHQEGQTMGSDVTGVISPLGMRETIDLALRLHPDTNTVAIITGLTEWDKRWLAVAHSELLRHQDRVREIDLIGPADLQTLGKDCPTSCQHCRFVSTQAR